MNLVLSGREGAERLAVGRAAFGVGAVLAPRLVGRAWIGTSGRASDVAVITRAFGVRDFALGFGAYKALSEKKEARGWIEAGIACDAVDAIGALLSPLPWAKRLPLAAVALSAAMAGITALSDL
jgi:hypothetical protein